MNADYINNPELLIFKDSENVAYTKEQIDEKLSKTSFITTKSNKVMINGVFTNIDTDNNLPVCKDSNLYISALYAEKLLSVSFDDIKDYISFEKDGETYIDALKLFNSLGKSLMSINSSFWVITNVGEEFDLDNYNDIKLLSYYSRLVIYDHPSSEEIVNTFKKRNNKNHPRMLFDSSKIGILRQRIKTEPVKSWADVVFKKADEYMKELPELKYYMPDNIRLAYMGQKSTDVICNLSLAYILTGDEKYAKRAIEDMMIVCNREIFPDWHPYHFLDVSEMVLGVAIGFDWCYDVLTESEKEIITKTIVDYALKPVMEDYLELPRERTWHWSSKSSPAYPQNWVEINFACTSLAALTVADEPYMDDIYLMADVVREGMERMRDCGEKLFPDGVYFDGTSYWSYSNNHKIIGLEALINALGTDYGNLNCIGFEESFMWIANLVGPTGTFNFDTNAQLFISSPQHFWASKRYNRADFNILRLNQFKEHNFEGSWRDIIFYEPQDENINSDVSLELRTRNRGNLVLRQGFGKNDTFLAAFTGIPDSCGTVHQEHDATFVLDMKGVRFMVDLGREEGNYTGSLKRYNYYRNRAEGHNTLIINPQYSYNYNPFTMGKFIKLEKDDKKSFAVYDFTKAIEFNGCTKWQRGYSVNKIDGSVEVRDEITLKEKGEIYSFLHTKADITLSDDLKSAKLSLDGEYIYVSLICDNKDVNFDIMDAIPLETSPQRRDERESDNSEFKKLFIHLKDIDNLKYSFKFTKEKPINLCYNDLDNWKI